MRVLRSDNRERDAQASTRTNEAELILVWLEPADSENARPRRRARCGASEYGNVDRVGDEVRCRRDAQIGLKVAQLTSGVGQE
jgi:hypothetical protein